MPVGAVNNNQQQTYALPGLLAGLGTGAIAGGTYGYLSKPWIKDGNITDKFIRQFDENNTKNRKDINAQFVADLKKIKETGKIDGISDATKFVLEKENKLESLTFERIKKYYHRFFEGLESSDKLLAERNKFNIDNTSLKVITESAEKCKAINIADNISIADLKKLYADNKELFHNHPVAFWVKKFDDENRCVILTDIGKILERNVNESERKEIVKTIQEGCEMIIADAPKKFADTKATILEHIDLSKKSMKELASDADFQTKEVFKVVKKTIKDMNHKASAKWGAIGTGVLGAIGLGIGAMNNKKS